MTSETSAEVLRLALGRCASSRFAQDDIRKSAEVLRLALGRCASSRFAQDESGEV